jgi:uncharacterized protein (DUF924 family)
VTANVETGPAAIVAFWRDAGPDKWFVKDEAFDREITERFGALHAEAGAGKLDAWARTPEGTLALLILLDQFSRNMFRGSAKTYAQDAKALAIAKRAVDAGFDREVDPRLKNFFHLPFRHSESIVDQDRSVALAHALGNAQIFRYARHHRDIVRRFGRFPHRNRILGRHTSAAEQAFIDGGGFGG